MLVGRPRTVRGRAPADAEGEYREGDVLVGRGARWLVLEAQRSQRRGLKYPWRLLLGPIAPAIAEQLVAGGARSFDWLWDRCPKGRRRSR